MTRTAPFIDLVQQELEAYRRTGQPVHLAHAARALNEALATLARTAAPQEAAECGRC